MERFKYKPCFKLKMAKSFLTKLGIAALMPCLAGCAGLDAVVSKRNAVEPPALALKKELSRLYVNTSADHYSMEKSREVGEKELTGLAKADRLEEALIFIKRTDGKQIWHEKGINETATGSTLDKPFEEIKDGENISSLSFYHFHPIEGDDILAEASQMPSRKDFIGALQLIIGVHQHYPSLAEKTDFRIAVSTGVYTIKIDAKNLEAKMQELEDALTEMQKEQLYILANCSKHFDYSPKNSKNFAELNRKFAETYSTDVMKISFEPK